MSERYAFSCRICLVGDEEIATIHIPRARVLMQQLVDLMGMNDGRYHLRRHVMEDDTVIRVEMNSGNGSITIDSSNEARRIDVEEETPEDEEWDMLVPIDDTVCKLYLSDGKLFSEMHNIPILEYGTGFKTNTRPDTLPPWSVNYDSGLIDPSSQNSLTPPWPFKWMGKTITEFWPSPSLWKFHEWDVGVEYQTMDWLGAFGHGPHHEDFQFDSLGDSVFFHETEFFTLPSGQSFPPSHTSILQSGEVDIGGQTRRYMLFGAHLKPYGGAFKRQEYDYRNSWEVVYLDVLYDADGVPLCPAAMGWFFGSCSYGSNEPQHVAFGYSSSAGAQGEQGYANSIAVAVQQKRYPYFFLTGAGDRGEWLDNKSWWSVLNDDGYPALPAPGPEWWWGVGPEAGISKPFAETQILPFSQFQKTP